MSPKVKKLFILTVGQTGTGKSTLHNAAGGHRSTTSSVDSDPAECGTTTFEFTVDGITYIVVLIDTPGIGDAGQNGQSLTDQEIRHEIGTFLQKENIRKVNAIFWIVKGDKADDLMVSELS